MDVAETLAAMANADGGELVVGIENDGTVTGVSQPEDRLLTILSAPRSKNYVNPPLPFRDRGLITGRNGHSVPSNAALLLFGKTPARWHPRCGLDFVRWQGTERKQGAEFNSVKRFPIEAPLSMLIRKAYDAILPILPERTNLQDLLFNEKLVYPVFAWQEAVVNAVAHRDYGIQGASIFMCRVIHLLSALWSSLATCAKPAKAYRAFLMRWNGPVFTRQRCPSPVE